MSESEHNDAQRSLLGDGNVQYGTRSPSTRKRKPSRPRPLRYEGGDTTDTDEELLDSANPPHFAGPDMTDGVSRSPSPPRNIYGSHGHEMLETRLVGRERSRRRQIPRLPGKSFLPSRRRVTNRTNRSQIRGVLDTLSDLDEESTVPSPQRMGCYCIAQAFEWAKLVKQARRVAQEHVVINEDVLRITLATWPPGSDVFIFASYGCLVFWSVEETAEHKFIEFMKSWIDDEDLLQEDEEADSFDWYYVSDRDDMMVYESYFLLPRVNEQDDNMQRLALSYACATSVKLDTFEVAIEATIQATQHIPEELSQKGEISLSKQEISRYIGELYIQKSAVNLTTDLLDSPDWLWDKPTLESYYQKTRKFLQIDNRCEVLNKRLDVLANLMDILRSFQTEQHSSRLELIVIWLIVVEIVLGLIDIFWNLFEHGHIDPM